LNNYLSKDITLSALIADIKNELITHQKEYMHFFTAAPNIFLAQVDNYFNRKQYNNDICDIIPLATATALAVRIAIVGNIADHLTLFSEITPLRSATIDSYIIIHLAREHYSATKLSYNMSPIHIKAKGDGSVTSDDVDIVSPKPRLTLETCLSPRLHTSCMPTDNDCFSITTADTCQTSNVFDGQSWPFTNADLTSYFTVVSLNIGSIFGNCHKTLCDSIGNFAKLDYLRHICCQTATPEMICLTETKLSNKIEDSEIYIDGYCVHRRDRNRQGGGVAIYYRDDLNAVPLDLASMQCAAVEFAAIKVSSRLKTIIFACFYRPPSSKAEWIPKFNESIEYLQSLNLPLCIMGDFNKNLLSDRSFADDIDTNYGLKQIINEPTRIQKITKTQKISRKLIDHICIPREITINSSGTFNLHNSDHLATYVQICCFNKPNKSSASHSSAALYRCTKRLNRSNLLKDLSLVPWHVISDIGTVDDALHTFEKLLIDVWDMHAPRKRRQRRRKATPWMTPQVLQEIRSRNQLYHRFRRNPSDENWVSYKLARNCVTNLIRIAKRSFLMQTASDSHNFWKTISRCTGLSGKRDIQPPWPCSSATICALTANALNSFFITAVEKVLSVFSSSCCGGPIVAPLPSIDKRDATLRCSMFVLMT
jgi:exonuclease III